MIQAGAELIASLCVMNDIEPSEISLHKSWRKTACPGRYFPEAEILGRVRELLEVD